MNSPMPQRLTTLLAHLRDEQLNAEEAAELEHLVLTDAEARRWYVRVQALQAGLFWISAAAGEGQPLPESVTAAGPRTSASVANPAAPQPPLRRPVRRRLLWAAGLLLAVTGALVWQWVASTPAPLATVTRIAGIEGGVEPWQPGAALFPGRVTLNAGMSELTFAHGAVLLLQGPAGLRLPG